MSKQSHQTDIVSEKHLAIRILAMPANTNPNGDVFGGWIVSQMDLAGLYEAKKITSSRVTTVAIDTLTFISPVKVGDFVCCYTQLLSVGRSSLRIRIETYAVGLDSQERRQVTEGVFTYVAIDEKGKPHPFDAH